MANRVLCWFSCGAASAVATKLTLDVHPDAEILYCDASGEHEDNKRFLKDCEKWFGKTIKVLKNPKYADHFDVIEKRRFINGPTGALCSFELKRKLREEYQQNGDVQVFGFTAEEEDRAYDFEDRTRGEGISLLFPLIEEGLSKEDCLALVQKQGIKLPEMYKLLYLNNNCIGCVKGGQGYWNKIRVDFPQVFDRMAKIERELEHTVLRKKGKPLYLDELDPKAGRYEEEPLLSCGLTCQMVQLRWKEAEEPTDGTQAG